MTRAKPFRIQVPESEVLRIKQRVADFPWHEMPNDGGWDYGTNLDYMKELCAYWVDHYDWRVHEAELNRLAQYTAPVDGMDIHFIHEKGSGDNSVPLLLTHGWPGSVHEFREIIAPLTHPEKFGGTSADSFDVIAPSLPGFGFSGRPPRPYGPRKMAGVLNRLMTDVLGYDRYLAQGGDWGGTISSWIGFDYPATCRAVHINILTLRHPDGPQTPEEHAWEARFARDQIMQEGYRTQQATKPQTLSYAMMDSPVGIAAWILEKFHGWSDISDNNVETAYSKDDLLTGIMIYIVTRTFNTASWIYYGRREEGGRVMALNGKRVEVPTACALFPREMSEWPPRSYVERMHNVVQWTKMKRGGHFGAMEQPLLLAEDIRRFAKTLRKRGLF